MNCVSSSENPRNAASCPTTDRTMCSRRGALGTRSSNRPSFAGGIFIPKSFAIILRIRTQESNGYLKWGGHPCPPFFSDSKRAAGKDARATPFGFCFWLCYLLQMQPETTPVAPVTLSERILFIDVLRGIALFGILAA